MLAAAAASAATDDDDNDNDNVVIASSAHVTQVSLDDDFFKWYYKSRPIDKIAVVWRQGSRYVAFYLPYAPL